MQLHRLLLAELAACSSSSSSPDTFFLETDTPCPPFSVIFFLKKKDVAGINRCEDKFNERVRLR